ncbi:LOW QUALITY PROTEIN: transmembrane protein 180-like [Amphiura filiformis]|uniref:LOW QUALITY PROTEIN: transmembrane protein 180-like n=1 Tax=Amphiura filiformis TaxID=82378 RepID=UPI003B21E738
MDRYLHSNAVVYASLILGFKMMTSIFSFYYVKIFLDHYHVSQAWFDVAQVIYLFWNAINDPLFAYWQDNSKLEIFRSRRLNVLYGAPLFALSFLLAWFPWGDYTSHPWLAGVHLLVVLSCWDTMLTFVGLAQCALFAEISHKQEDRLLLTKYTQVASILGASSVFFSQVLCDGLNNMASFQVFVVVLSLMSWGAMHYTGKHVRTMYDNVVPAPVDIESPSIPFKGNNSSGKKKLDSSSLSSFTQFKQIARQKNFIIFITVNFMQIFQTTYIRNFLSIFGDELLPQHVMSPFYRKFLYGSAFIIPQILVLCLSPVVGRKGYYRVILWSFYFKVVCAVLVFMAGRQQYMLLSLFMVIESSLPFAIFAFFSLAVSNIIDADQERYKRRLPLSSSVFAYNALFTKPAQSLAPMMIVAILNRNNYQEKVSGDMTAIQHQELSSAMFTVACAIPFVIGLLQILVWRPFSIRDSHITIAKHIET